MAKTKKKRQSRDTEKEEQSGTHDGRAAHQRPNCCDTFMLALVCFFFIIVLAVSIPLLMSATGTMDIEYINKKLQTVGKEM